MMDNKDKVTQLGKILVEKGIITAEQLNVAVIEQRRRREHLSDQHALQATALGEVLIDLGFITRLQLKRSLNWQSMLRKFTMAMALIAPLMTLGSGAAAATSTTALRSSLPQTIEAESYTSMFGVQIEPTQDTSGVKDVGYLHPGDWMSFSGTTVYIPTTGTYKISYRVSGAGAGGSFALKEADSSVNYGTVLVPNTGGFQTWTTVETTVNITAGTHSFLITDIVRGGGFNINWFKIEDPNSTSTVAPPAPPPVSQTIEAESYTSMYGIQVENTLDVSGDKDVGYINPGDWLSFSGTSIYIPVAGTYKLSYRVASAGGGGSFVLKEADESVTYDTVSVPNTGGFQTWTTVEHQVYLPAGMLSFLITDMVRGSGFNINWFKVESLNAPGSTTSTSTATTTATTTTTASSRASSSAPSTTSTANASTPSTQTSTTPPVPSSAVSGPVNLNWSVPSKRENLSVLDITELGGYELRYKLASEDHFTYITINDPWTTTYFFPWLSGNYIFQVAAFDSNGFYSTFVDLTPR